MNFLRCLNIASIGKEKGQIRISYLKEELVLSRYLFGDINILEASFLGFKKHTDKTSSPYIKDINDMKTLFKFTSNEEFEKD